jgi:hypothetical protein
MVDLYFSAALKEDELSLIEVATPKLREIVARTLSHEDTGVFPASEVSLETHYLDTAPVGREPTEHADSMECNVQVIISANFYPWREDIKDELAQQIMDEYGLLLPEGVTAWAWLKLHHAGFARRKMPAPTK